MTISMEDSGSPKWKLVDQYNRVFICKSGRRLLVGRDGCDVLLKSKSVDPKHAVVEFDEEAKCLTVQDLSTQNGTFVNDCRIQTQTSVQLTKDDRIRFGYDPAQYRVEPASADDEKYSIMPSAGSQYRSYTTLHTPHQTLTEAQRVLSANWTHDFRRSSDGSSNVAVTNGLHSVEKSSAPVQPVRRRSVQELYGLPWWWATEPVTIIDDTMDNAAARKTDDDDDADNVEEDRKMDASPCLVIVNNNKPAGAKEGFAAAQADEEKESEEEKAQLEVLEKHQSKEAEQVHQQTQLPPPITRPSQAFTIDLNALSSSPDSPRSAAVAAAAVTAPPTATSAPASATVARSPADEGPKSTGREEKTDGSSEQPLCARMPDHIKQRIQEREEKKAAKLQEAREAKEREKEREKELEKEREKERQSGPAKQTSGGGSGPNFTDSRRRSSSNRAVPRNSSAARVRQRSASKGRPGSVDGRSVDGESGHRVGLGRSASNAAAPAPERRRSRADSSQPRPRNPVRRAASMEKGPSGPANGGGGGGSSGQPNVPSAAGKSYLFAKMFSSSNQPTALVGARIGDLNSSAMRRNNRQGGEKKPVSARAAGNKNSSSSNNNTNNNTNNKNNNNNNNKERRPGRNNGNDSSGGTSSSPPEVDKEADVRSTPSEAGTYTIEDEKAQKAKEALSSLVAGGDTTQDSSDHSDPINDTSGPLMNTQEALDALERIHEQKLDGADSDLQFPLDAKRRNTASSLTTSFHSHQQSTGGELLYNVLSSGPGRSSHRGSSSEQGSDAEHSPITTGSRSSVTGAAGSGSSRGQQQQQQKKPRDGSAVRRSNSDTHNTNRTFQLRRNNALANRESESSPTSSHGRPGVSSSSSASNSAARRRMSTGNSCDATAAAAGHDTTAGSSRKGSVSTSQQKAHFHRNDYGRFSLKSQSQAANTAAQRSPRQPPQHQQQQQQQKAEALEMLKRRKAYDPRKAVAASHSARKPRHGSESENQTAADGHPRRTSSADARPITERDPSSQRVPPSTSHGGTGSVGGPSRRSGATVRRHESLNTEKPNRQPRHGAVMVPNTASLLAPRPPASAFLDVRSPIEHRSQSVSHAEAACSEVAYDLLLVSSIFVMTGKLRAAFDDLVEKLRDQRVLTRTPTPIDELFQSRPPAHLNSTNTELKEALANLRSIECRYQTLKTHLLQSTSTGAVSARTNTLGGCTDTEYQQELRRINSELEGFVPIEGDDDNDGDVDVGGHEDGNNSGRHDPPSMSASNYSGHRGPVRPVPVQATARTQDNPPRRLESSF